MKFLDLGRCLTSSQVEQRKKKEAKVFQWFYFAPPPLALLERGAVSCLPEFSFLRSEAAPF